MCRVPKLCRVRFIGNSAKFTSAEFDSKLDSAVIRNLADFTFCLFNMDSRNVQSKGLMLHVVYSVYFLISCIIATFVYVSSLSSLVFLPTRCSKLLTVCMYLHISKELLDGLKCRIPYSFVICRPEIIYYLYRPI